MKSTLKRATVSLAAIILATAAYAESASHGSGQGAVKPAAEESHGEPVLQFHFQSPSEHAVNGKLAVAECQQPPRTNACLG